MQTCLSFSCNGNVFIIRFSSRSFTLELAHLLLGCFCESLQVRQKGLVRDHDLRQKSLFLLRVILGLGLLTVLLQASHHMLIIFGPASRSIFLFLLELMQKGLGLSDKATVLAEKCTNSAALLTFPCLTRIFQPWRLVPRQRS